jgi:hypothetical protein
LSSALMMTSPFKRQVSCTGLPALASMRINGACHGGIHCVVAGQDSRIHRGHPIVLYFPLRLARITL